MFDAGAVQEIAAFSPLVLVALLLFGLALLIVSVFALREALRGTSEEARPDIIRSLGDFFRALLWRRK
jgi:hypothetical protein